MVESGTGVPALVLLHGLGTGARGWAPQIDALSGHRLVLAPYFPGYGGSRATFSIDTACEALLTLLDERGLTVVDLAGLSLGAIVALEFALRQPARVRRLVLCGGFAKLSTQLRSQQDAAAAALARMPEDAAGEVITNLVAGVPTRHRCLISGPEVGDEVHRGISHPQAGLLKQLPVGGSRWVLARLDTTRWHLHARFGELVRVLQHEQLVDTPRQIDKRLLAPTMFARKASGIVVRHRD